MLLILALPLGWYIKQIMQNNIPKGVRFLQPVEKLFYKIIGPVSQKEMTAKRYIFSVLSLSLFFAHFTDWSVNDTRMVAGRKYS